MEAREKIHAEMKAKLSKTRETINELRIKMEEQRSGDSRTAAPSLDDLHARQDAAERILEKLRQNGRGNWHSHKSDLDRYLEDIDDGLRKALAYFH